MPSTILDHQKQLLGCTDYKIVFTPISLIVYLCNLLKEQKLETHI